MIKNKTKDVIMGKEVVYCKTISSKALGLMFKRKTDKALIFVFKKEKIVHIHMFFVFFPIDVLWLDKNKRVVQLKECLKPFKFIRAKRPAKYIIELPVNTINKSKTRLGDTISFK